MKTFPILLGLLALATLAPSARAAQSSPRQRVLMDADWRFHLAEIPVVKNPIAIPGWRWKALGAAPTDEALAATPPTDTAGTDWQGTAPGQDIFGGRVGYAWLEATLPEVPGPRRVLRLSVDDNADVYLNGQKLMHHDGWNETFDVPLDAGWHEGGPNVLAILAQNTAGAGGLGPTVVVGTNPQPATNGDPSQPGFSEGGWQTVHLPHDFVVEQKFTPTADANHASLPVPTGWYRKTFTLPASDKGKSVWIDFDGIYRDSTAYLNGRKLGEHLSGYTSFRYDISKTANYGGRNVLAVYVNPRHYEGWWYEGGGIYRHVWLNVADPLHVAPWGTFVTSQIPEPGPDGVPTAPANLSILTTLTNDAGTDASGEVVSQVLDEDGAVVATSTTAATVPAGQRQDVTQQATVTQPRLWSLQARHLYRLHTEVRRDGQVVDTQDTPFGIRTIRYDANSGFFLNGQHVEIQGVCNHQDFAGVGIAVPDSLEDYRVRRLKETMGANGWRMSHNPPTPGLLDACDKEGMLVMDENRHLGDTYSDHTPSGTGDADLSDLADLIQRDRNHPSVIMWSMCNEEGLQSTPEGAKIFSAMMGVVHKYDTTRPISSAMNGGWFDPGDATVEDLLGINYGLGNSDRYHQLHPTQPIFGSETASTTTARGVYATDDTNGWVTSYNMTDGSWQAIASRPFVAGSFDWTGFDYKGEPTPFRWPDINSNFGILDMCGFPKDNAYYLKSWWTTQPVLHLMPHWNWAGKEGQPIRVIAFSNCDHVELFLNGQSLGRKDMPREGHLEWTVPYAPGTLTAKGYNGDAVAATDTVTTTGAPAALVLKTTDRTNLVANGEEVQPVEVDVVDSQGRVVPTADNLISFGVKGAGHIAGVGNGNPSDHDPDHASQRHAFNGLCMVVVGANDRAGGIQVTASAPGLKSASLQLTAEPAP